MMTWNGMREAFWENPYRFIANVLTAIAFIGLLWALTPWFPLDLGIWP